MRLINDFPFRIAFSISIQKEEFRYDFFALLTVSLAAKRA